MRYTLCLLLLAASALRTLAQDTKLNITVEDLYKKNTFKVKNVPGFNAMNDGTHYTQIDTKDSTQSIVIYDLASGQKGTELFNSGLNRIDGKRLHIDDYVLSKDEKKIMLLTEGENIYRRSVVHYVYIYDTRTGSLQQLDKDKVLHATFSPDGTKVAFVKGNNLYSRELGSGSTTQITKDGEWNHVINGNCDWVYEEEFSFTRAYDWSKSGNYLAYYRFDESKVPEYTIARYNGLYPEQYSYKYPKAGEPNSTVQIKIYDLAGKTSVNADLGQETDQYIPRIKWTQDDDKLCIYRMNRHQNKLELLMTGAATGRSQVIYTEENKYFIDINDQVTFLPDGHSMIWRNEQDGYNHLYHYDWTTHKSHCLTPGNYDVDALTGVDVPNKLIYYTAAKTAPTQRNLYSVDFSGKKERCLTPAPGMHAITPCDGFKYFVDNYSALNSVPVHNLIDKNGAAIRTLEDNSELKKTMAKYNLGQIRLLKLKGVDDSLNAWMITPPDFDPAKKYPVLMFQYSGPGSQQVADQFPVGYFWWHQLLAEHGYIIVCADGTGTGFRGEAFKKKTYLQLGKYESDDQIAVARNLGDLPYVDKNRIGIWGWSYGGFMSATCILKGHDVFKTAIAVAPVTNWRYYDNIYTERYMRTPQENPKGYDENAPEKMAGMLQGKFLVIHGTGDDNVHFQNSVMLTTALINADKDFDSEYYPDKTHGISGGNTRNQLFRRMTEFILENL